MKRFLPQPIRRAYLTRREERGNFLVITALLMTVLIGVVALVVDVGFAAGQRRFMQNGADAAALAAADLLSGSVSPYPVAGPWPHGIPSFFNVTDATVRAKAVEVATKNQGPGISGRTTSFSVTVEYCVAANNNSYAPQTVGCSSPNSWVASPTTDGRVPDGAYKVRVTVNSTITTIFGGVIGKKSTTSDGQGIAIVLGVCPQLYAVGNIWPVTLCDQQDFGADPNQLFQLWSSNAQCPNTPNSWKNVLDLSPPTVWCDGQGDDYSWTADSSYTGMVPDGTECTPDPSHPNKDFTGTDTSWNRGLYEPDPRGSCYTGSSSFPDDIATWISGMYNGELAVGMKVPIFPKGGDAGNNIGDAISGKTGVNACTGTYFFDGVTAIDPNHPTWGVYRDVTVFTYDVSNDYQKNKQWVANGNKNSVGRVTLMRILNVRIYSNESIGNDSSVLGLVISPDEPPDYDPQSCPAFGSLGPGIYGNVVRLGA